MSGGIEGERPHGERTLGQKQNSPEAGAGPLGLPPPIPEQQRPQQEKSTLNRAVERTRTLYESNGWVFVPLGEAGKLSPSLSNPQEPKPQEQSQRRDRTSYAGATLYSGVGLFDVLKRKEYYKRKES